MHNDPLPDIPWDDMEEMCTDAPCQNLLVNKAGFDEYERDEFDDDFDNDVSLLVNMGFSAVAIGNRVGHESVDITCF